jgi:hypothetical protein
MMQLDNNSLLTEQTMYSRAGKFTTNQYLAFTRLKPKHINIDNEEFENVVEEEIKPISVS